MITRLFSVFDPSSRILSLPLNWFSTFLGIIFLPYIYWVSPRRWVYIWNKILNLLLKEFQVLLGVRQTRLVLIFVSLFRLILFNNFIGLFPYIFTSSRHLVVTLSLSLPLWLGFILYGWINHTQHIFAHLVPNGTPFVLIPFMVLIETIRNLIRPGTLAVRLAANIIAGHLLLRLIGGAGVGMGYILVRLLVLSQILLLLLESAVAVIQSYVFAILRTLYAREVV